MKIKLTTIYVDDIDNALHFYTDVLGFVKKADFSNGPYRWLTVVSPEDADGTELQLAQRQSGGGGVSAGDVSTGPAGDHVLHRRRESRLRAHQVARRRVQDGTNRRDRVDDCAVERHLRQSHPTHPAGALIGAIQ
jgi:catechol 2,3-dioxygenase-like lactoylglutathione lyase family enzyme